MKHRTLFLLLALGLAMQVASACPPSDGARGTVQDLTVVSPTFGITADQDERTITTVGLLRNGSSACIDGIRVEVRYFDAKNALIDTVTSQLYQVEVPAGQEVAFRVRTDAARAKDLYASQLVRVVSVGAAGKQKSLPAPESLLVQLVSSWGPMLLLIGVWIFFMRKINRKDSPQAQSLRLIEQQNVLFDTQNKLLERLAIAAEQGPQAGDRA